MNICVSSEKTSSLVHDHNNLQNDYKKAKSAQKKLDNRYYVNEGPRGWKMGQSTCVCVILTG